MNFNNLEIIKKELEKRRSFLIKLAHLPHTKIDPTDRKNIIRYIEKLQLPQKPKNEIRLSKEFFSSCFSINQPPYRMRDKLKSFIGKIPIAETIPICLSKLFDEPSFLDDKNWKFFKIKELSLDLNRLPSNITGMKAAILQILFSGSEKMMVEIEKGLDAFYDKIAQEIDKGPENTWNYMIDFTKTIPGVGPGLFSDFLKNIGFPEFVKIDHHFKNEFPTLIGSEKLSDKRQFVKALQLCIRLEMTPFYFDHLMYQWGRYKKLCEEKYCQETNRAKTVNHSFQREDGADKTDQMANEYKTSDRSEENLMGEKRFDNLIKSNKKWRDECFKLTTHRQAQLLEILELYDGNKIPFSHFTHEITTNMKLRNKLAYPAVCAYICGILKKSDGGLIKPPNLRWGEKILTNKENLW